MAEPVRCFWVNLQNPIYVRYHDPMENALVVKQFYVGDRSAPFKWFNLSKKGTRYTTLSFDIIER